MILIPKKRAVVFRLRDPGRITNIIPTAKVITVKGQELVAVPHRVEETKVLRNLGFDVPAPIRYHYDWPRGPGIQPFKAQIEAAAFLTLYNRAFNLSELGTGKSLASLWAYDFLRASKKAHKALIVSPLSTLERTWADEIFQHFPHLTCAVLHGSRDKRLKLLNQDVDVYIVNHDGVEIIAPALKDRADIDVVMVDEVSQVARNASTDRWKALNTVVNKQVPRLCWGMSGTPTPNAPTDAWAQCRLLVPANVPPYATKFKELVMRQVSQFNWVPKENATETVRQAMQPAIRFTRAECVDLPPLLFETRQIALTSEQDKAYKEMVQKLHTEAVNGEITAVNEAVKMSKLVQICCIAAGTDVLTSRGWVPIQDVTALDSVWDGEEWVQQRGAVLMGRKPVIQVRGVYMTPDHKVWAGEWVEAQEVLYGDASEKLNRTAVRLPNGVRAGRDQQGEHGDMVVSMRLRQRGGAGEPVSACEAPTAPAKLWMPPRQRNAQTDADPTLQRVGKHAPPLRRFFGQGLAKLRGARDYCLRQMDEFVSELPRRHFRWIQERLDSWPNGQRWPIFARELPLGDAYAAGQQQTVEQVCRDAQGSHDGYRGGESVRTEKGDVRSATGPVRLAAGESTADTYDLIDCGPRTRFVVRGATGAPMIVHNCGVAYSPQGEEITIPSAPRLRAVQEIVEDAEGKVIVFVPFVSSVKMVSEYLAKHFSVEVIHGGVNKAERDRIFGAFQKTKEPKVLVAQPAAMSHGLTLTAASTIVWYSCTTSNEVFEQANGRINRPGQKMNNFIIMLEGSPVERRIYARLQTKQKMQGALLDEIKALRHEVIA